MYLDTHSTPDKVRAAIPVVAVHVLLALVLLRGLQGGVPAGEPDPLRLVHETPPTIVEPAPLQRADTAPPRPLREADPRPDTAASPPDLTAEPPPFVAPEPIVRPPIQPPTTVPTAPVAGTGSAPSAGAAPIRGPGTGSGGLGDGRGSGRGGGGGGTGGGGGGAGRVFTMPRQIAGDFSWRDIPESLQQSGFRGTIGVRFLIDVDGRAKQCRIIRRSRSPLMDAAVCRLVEQRYRFVPARDAAGRPVAIPGEDFPTFEVDGRNERRRRDDW